jgi:Transglutaminase-like superfamily
MMIKLKKACSAWLALPWNRHKLLLETTFALTCAVLAKHLLPFRVLSRALGEQISEEHLRSDELLPSLRAELVWAFGVWQRYWRFPPVCLTEVLALKIMLRCRNIRSSVFIGVALDPSKGFQAHTWICCGHSVLPRKQQLDYYKVISIFCD